MVELRTVTYAKISPEMVDPRDLAGDAKEVSPSLSLLVLLLFLPHFSARTVEVTCLVKEQSNEPVKQADRGHGEQWKTDCGHREQWKVDRLWKQRTMEDRLWTQRTMEGGQTVEAENNGRQIVDTENNGRQIMDKENNGRWTDCGNREQWKTGRPWKQRTMEDRKARQGMDRKEEPSVKLL